MNLNNIYNKGWARFFLKIITFIFLVLGGITSSLKIWNFADAFIGILAFINIYAIFKLRNEV